MATHGKQVARYVPVLKQSSASPVELRAGTYPEPLPAAELAQAHNLRPRSVAELHAVDKPRVCAPVAEHRAGSPC